MRVYIDKKPSDPNEAELWIEEKKRIVIEMMIAGGAQCAHCKSVYSSADDFIMRNPKKGFGEDSFVDAYCWKAYLFYHNQSK